jgi:hypothetical protein
MLYLLTTFISVVGDANPHCPVQIPKTAEKNFFANGHEITRHKPRALLHTCRRLAPVGGNLFFIRPLLFYFIMFVGEPRALLTHNTNKGNRLYLFFLRLNFY